MAMATFELESEIVISWLLELTVVNKLVIAQIISFHVNLSPVVADNIIFGSIKISQ